jgi:diguanylate cyclase (GGDEF)-like protein
LRYLDKEIVHSQGENKEFSVVMVDVDNFKEFNDNFGHDVGMKFKNPD